jgi:hypothetical protein
MPIDSNSLYDQIMRDFEVIGWQETVQFPDWGGAKMRAKVDTGARSSAIHAEDFEIVRRPSTPERPLNEVMIMTLKVGPRAKPKFIQAEAPVVDYRSVKNSGGKIEERPFIQTQIELNGVQHPIVLSVTNRDKMKFPILLGRAFLAGKYLVDSSARNLLKKKAKVDQPEEDFEEE